MNFYPHHIGDFNNSTRHLTRVERSVYRDAIELYYDTESALTLDIDRLYRKLLCQSDEEKNALNAVLDEFFLKTKDGYTHERCEIEISKYRSNTNAKARAGIASAAKRKQNSTLVEHNSTGVHNQEPVTKNQEPNKTKARSQAPAFELPDWIPADTWAAYLAVRKAIKKPCTDHAALLAIKKLDELRAQGHQPQAVLEQSILNSWQGLFEIKAARTTHPYESAKDKLRRETYENLTGKKSGTRANSPIDITAGSVVVD